MAVRIVMHRLRFSKWSILWGDYCWRNQGVNRTKPLLYDFTLRLNGVYDHGSNIKPKRNDPPSSWLRRDNGCCAQSKYFNRNWAAILEL